MKKSDVAMIVLIAGVSVLVSYFIVKTVVGGTYTGSAKVKTVQQISGDVEEPNPEIFNKDSINPSVRVVIKDPNNTGQQSQ